MKVLLVDDEAGIRKVLGIYLEDAGYEVHTADNGKTAFQMINDLLPDIVLTDIKMPGMSGVDLLAQTKAHYPEIEMVMITGHGDMKLAIESLKMDAVDFIAKPIDNDILDIALKRANDRIETRKKLANYTKDLERLVKEKTAKLAESEQRYVQLFNESPSYITIQDKDYNIIESNNLFKEHFSFKAGMCCYQVYKAIFSPCENCPVEKTFADGKSHFAEMDVKRKDGRIRNIFIQTSAIKNTKGKTKQVMEMSTDVTIIRRLQEHLANLGLHISSISHGIKGVLTGLDGGSYMISSGLDKRDTDLIEEGWEIVKERISSIRQMVVDILYHSKERKLFKSKVVLSKFMNELVKILAPRLDKANVSLNLDLPEESVQVIVDEISLFAALLSVLDNSVDACESVTKKRKQLSIDFSAQIKGNNLMFVIKDNGSGLTKGQQDMIFSLFYSDKKKKGTGLGLFIAKKSIQQHGGTITVDSKKDVFTEFTITL
ncbi:MAG: response regulator, partial [Desulfobacteraceae bacterium]|nr:response regulator [Desulfobacteraceae bacterium]